METKKVYGAICAVMGDLSKVGISKDNTNLQQKFKFRGIDDVYNTLSPLLAEHKLIIVPRVVEEKHEERMSNNGGRLNYVFLQVEFDVISAEDGSCHTARIASEAMDSADKATNKAIAAAYKYMIFTMFCVPTEGDNDADGTTPSVAPVQTGPTDSEKEAGAYLKSIGFTRDDMAELKKYAVEEKTSWSTLALEGKSEDKKTVGEFWILVKEGRSSA